MLQAFYGYKCKKKEVNTGLFEVKSVSLLEKSCLSSLKWFTMAVKCFINPKCESPLVKALTDGLCTEFDRKGTVIFQNRRNVIKSFVLADGQTLVVKRFRVKGWLNTCLRMFARSKARKAYENGLLLERAGIGTPAPVACVEQWNGRVPVCSYYVCAFTPDITIQPLLEGERPDERMVDAFAALMAHMHEQGIVHHDLNLSNVLYREENGTYRLSVIDINRVTMKKRGELTLSDSKDDFMRFTGRLDVFLAVAYSYARLRGWDAERFVRKQTAKKIRHDAQWTRRKKIHHFFHHGFC